MPKERFYHPQPLQLHETITLSREESRHLAQVMRVKSGESVEIVNGAGVLAKALVSSSSKDSVSLAIQHIEVAPPPTSIVALAQAYPRQTHLDFIIEKSTELGVDEIFLFPGRLSEKKELSQHQINRLEKLSIAALKQCGRVYLPKIHSMPPLEKWGSLPLDAAYFGDTDPSAPIFWKLMQHAPGQDRIIFIGPESGWAQNEIETLLKLGATGVKLHGNVLRTETAAIASLALMQHHRLCEIFSTMPS